MTKSTFFAAAVLMLGVCHAADFEAIPADGAHGTQTRDEVRSELFRARQNGELKVFSSVYNPARDMKSTKTREQVNMELQAARDSGEFEVLNATEVAVASPHKMTRGVLIEARHGQANR